MSLPGTMKHGLYFGNNDARVAEGPVPTIGPREVLVRVATCGICGSDTMQWYREPAIQRMGGINTGHEIAGEIVEVGGSVSQYAAGDRVIVVHHFPCMECPSCQDGNETACEAMREKHIEPGGFSQYIRVLEKCVAHGLYRLPDSMTYEQGSFVEPLGCVVRGMRKASPVAGRTAMQRRPAACFEANPANNPSQIPRQGSRECRCWHEYIYHLRLAYTCS